MARASDFTWYPAAKSTSMRTGWDADVVLAQWIVETGHFESNNFRVNNNIAGQTWQPYMGEDKKGTARPSNEGGYYIKYSNPVDGYVDFIQKNSRYKNVKTMKTEDDQIDEIARQGWAEDSNYASTLKQIVREIHSAGYDTPTNFQTGSSDDVRVGGGGGQGGGTGSTKDWGTGTEKKGNFLGFSFNFDEAKNGAFGLVKTIDQLETISPVSDLSLTNAPTYLVNNMRAVSFRSMIVVVGLVLMILALWKMTK